MASGGGPLHKWHENLKRAWMLVWSSTLMINRSLTFVIWWVLSGCIIQVGVKDERNWEIHVRLDSLLSYCSFTIWNIKILLIIQVRYAWITSCYSMSVCEADSIPGLVRTLDYIECYSLVFHMTLVWKVWGSLYTRVIILVHIHLNHSGSKAILT